MRFEPVGGDAGGDLKRDSSGIGPLHALDDYALELFKFIGHYIEYQFVMHLHNHARTH